MGGVIVRHGTSTYRHMVVVQPLLARESFNIDPRDAESVTWRL